MTWLLVRTRPPELRIMPVPAARPCPPFRLVVMSMTPADEDAEPKDEPDEPDEPDDEPPEAAGAEGNSWSAVVGEGDPDRCCHAIPAAALPTNKATKAAAA